MPNHTTNHLVVVGPAVEIKKFIDSVNGKDEEGEPNPFDLNKLIPQPEDVEDWYNWRVKNWGTKWNTYNHGSDEFDFFKVDIGMAEAHLIYHTAWTPPSNFLEKVSRMFPDLVFVNRAADDGGGFLVVETFENGEYTEEEFEWDSEEGEELKEFLGLV